MYIYTCIYIYIYMYLCTYVYLFRYQIISHREISGDVVVDGGHGRGLVVCRLALCFQDDPYRRIRMLLVQVIP